MASIEEDENRWHAESDARTLSEANIIGKDKSRLTAAIQQAKIMAEKEQEEAKSMKTVAKRKIKTESKKPRNI